jgi:hypothetical protein
VVAAATELKEGDEGCGGFNGFVIVVVAASD